MTTKRLNSQKPDEEPLEKRGCADATSMDDVGARLDDEMEEELREFERLQYVLSGATLLQNLETVVTEDNNIPENENSEQKNGCGSDMEVDEDLEQEIAAAKRKNSKRRKNSKTPLEKIDRASKKLFLDGTVRSYVGVLPDAFAEENLWGDDLLEKSGIPVDGEEACLDMEQAQICKDAPATDPLNPECAELSSKSFKGDASQQKYRQNYSEQSALQLRKRKPKEEEENHDFPSPPKQKSWSYAAAIPSGLGLNGARENLNEPSEFHKSRLRKGKPSTLKTQQLTSELPLMGSSLVTKTPSQRLLKERPQQIKVPPESKVCEAPQGTSQNGNDIYQTTSTVTREALIGPVLRIPVQLKSSLNHQNTSIRNSMCDDPKPSCSKDYHIDSVSTQLLGPGELKRNRLLEKNEKKMVGNAPQPGLHHVRALNFNQPTTLFDHRVQSTPLLSVDSSESERPNSPISLLKSPRKGKAKQIESMALSLTIPKNPKPPRHPEYMEFLQNSKNAVNSGPSPGQQELEAPPISQNQPGNPPPITYTIDITADPPVEYCIIENVIQRRFEHSFLLDKESFELMEADRPSISCPELSPFETFYKNLTWLAPCNELKRFYCWPCLFFSSKAIWSVSCDGQTEAFVEREINKHKQSPIHPESLKQFDAWSEKKKCSIITALQNDSFVDGTWSDENQEAIIIKGRPCPILNNRTEKKTKADKTSAFKDFYRRIGWICGCTSTEKLYCWPCVLFCRTGASAEVHTYAGTIESADAAVKLHEMQPNHMDACLKLGKWKFGLKKKFEAKEEQNEKLHSFLIFLVEVLCAEKKKINNSEFSTDDYLSSLEIMSQYNRKLKTLMEEKSENNQTNTAQTVALYVPAILDSVEYFIKIGILDEIKNSNFICLIFDHSSGLSYKAALSVIVRYVDRKGHVHERFVKLLNVGYNTHSNTLSDEFFQTIIELQCRSSLVGFTYDGYFIKPDKIPEFNAKVQRFCPDAKFFHYSEHTFIRVLQQTLSHVPICRSVLQNIKELANFFESNPRVRKTLQDIIKVTGKSERDDFWRSPDFVRTVFVYHAVIVETMEIIYRNVKKYRVKTVVQAKNFLDFFNDVGNRFFVTVIARIFDAVVALNKAHDGGDGNEHLVTIANLTVAKIQNLGQSFRNLQDSACSHLEGSDQKRAWTEMSPFRGIFMNVIQQVIKLIRNRIIETESDYFRISKEPPTSKTALSVALKHQNLFLQNLALPLNFNSTKLSTETQFIRDTSTFSSLGLTEIISQMNNYNMIEALPEFFKFLQLALTVPKNYSVDSTIPAVHRISAYIEGKKDLNSVEALLWMEKEFLTDLQKGADFYEKVTDRVLSITKDDGIVKSIRKF